MDTAVAACNAWTDKDCRYTGISSIDFMVRETRAVIRGDMAIVRLGSCGSLTDSFPVGAVGV